MREVVSEGLVYQYGYTTKNDKAPGLLLIRITSNLHRGKINVDEVNHNPRGLSKDALAESLTETDDINSSDESIATIAEEIRRQTLLARRDNPYILTEGVVSWIKDNIEYTLVPKYAIQRVEETIRLLPADDRLDLYKILRNAFNLKDELLRKVADSVYLPDSFLKEAPREEVAKALMLQAGNWRFFQLLWLKEDEVSAKKTLEEKAGKCVGIANLAVALSRNLGIPSTTLSGYYGDSYGKFGGNHKWARSYFHPYGWIEFDPTVGELADFSYDTHAYELFMRGQEENFPKLTVIGGDQPHPTGLVNRIQQLLENDRTLLDRILRRKPHAGEMEFLQSVSKD